MFPNSETIGVVLNQNEVALAQFAYQRARDTMRTGDELKLPSPNEDGMFALDNFSALQVLSAAKVAKRISDDNLWAANSRYAYGRSHDAEPEELQVLFIEKQSEKENISQFGELYTNTEACLSESQDIFISRKLADDV